MPPLLIIGIGVGLVLLLAKSGSPSKGSAPGVVDDCISRAADTVTGYVVQVASVTGAKSLSALDPSFADPAVEKCLSSNSPAGCRAEIKKVVASRIAGAFHDKNAQLVAEVIGVCRASGDQSSSDCLTKKAQDMGLVLGTIPTPPAIPGMPGGGASPPGFPLPNLPGGSIPASTGTMGDPVTACLQQLAAAAGMSPNQIATMPLAELAALGQKLALQGQFAAATCAGIIAASRGQTGPSSPLPSI